MAATAAATTDIALCYGTRPQVIKASRLRAALGRRHRVLAVDTGQHYDYALNALLYEQLGVAAPDVCLEVGSAGHAEQTALVLARIEPLLRERAPRAVVVIGDTNSTLGCALAAVKLRIPVVHVEAGLRADDALMAEEINRRAVDAVAQLLCAPSARAAERLAQEGAAARTLLTGDVARDVLCGQLASLPDPATALPAGITAPYIFATLHRAELTDQPERLAAALAALAALELPVVLATHPRTRAVLERSGLGVPADAAGRLELVPAVGYRESLALTRGAAVVVTDSGGVQREAYWLGTPCVTLRGETEWGETVALGANRLVAPVADAEALRGALGAAVREQRARSADGAGWERDAYGTGDAAERIAAATAALLAAH
ncbi:MAG TPA: UDP-N-acetylglucosamine 2-epimerase (non-hydrolyzing) [Gemmatimonadales bacterium]|nr:UDP-N-acetylglucosamine 2-epimerase (non-hydrolyzing) [Gemmatimonadales bacterium]